MAAPSGPVQQTATAVAAPFGTRWNNWVDGTFNRLVEQLDVRARFSVDLDKTGNQETARKVAKMVVLLLPLIAFTLLAAIGSGLSTLKASIAPAPKQQTTAQSV